MSSRILGLFDESPRSGPGRRSKLTRETARSLLKSVRAGATSKTACLRAGIGETTLYQWLDKGRQQKAGPFAEFRQQFMRAYADKRFSLEIFHYELSKSGVVVSKPRCRKILTDKGVIQTTEILKDAAGKPLEWVDHWVELSPEAKEKAVWKQLCVRAPEVFSDDAPTAVSVQASDTPNVLPMFLGAISLLLDWKVLPEPRPPRKAVAIETTATTGLPREGGRDG